MGSVSSTMTVQKPKRELEAGGRENLRLRQPLESLRTAHMMPSVDQTAHSNRRITGAFIVNKKAFMMLMTSLINIHNAA